jgi:hypothetical protein
VGPVTAAVLVLSALVLLFAAVRLGTRQQPGPRRLPPPRHPVAPAPKRRLRRDVSHALYEYDHARIRGRIYIGISSDPSARHKRHEARSPWFKFSIGYMRIVRWYPNYAEARAAEIAAIAQAAYAGEPIANDRDNPLRRGVRRAA